MRILLVNAFFSPLTTGSSHFSLDMAREYSRLGHQVTVLTAQPHGTLDFEIIDDIPVHRIPTFWIKPGNLSFNYSLPFVTRPRNIRKIREIFKEFNPDVIHQNGQFFDLTILTTVFAFIRKKHRVLTIHTPLIHTNSIFRAIISIVDRLFLAPLVKLGRVRSFAVDKFTMDLCNRRYGQNKANVSFIPASLNPNEFIGGDRQKTRHKLGLDDKKIILSFGHVIPIRNRITLVNALPEILRQVPNAHLVIVGEVYDSTFLDLASKLNVTENITVVGRVPHGDVPDYLAAADIECHDVNSHGLGITTFEVMAAGVPIVASVEEDAFPDINLKNWPAINIHSHLTASELAKEIVRSLSLDSSTYRETLNQQREFVVSNFGSEIVAKKYLDVFVDLVEK